MAESKKYNVVLDHVKTSQHPNTRVLFVVTAASGEEAMKKAREHGEKMHFVFAKGWEFQRCDGAFGDARMIKLHGEPIRVD